MVMTKYVAIKNISYIFGNKIFQAKITPSKNVCFNSPSFECSGLISRYNSIELLTATNCLPRSPWSCPVLLLLDTNKIAKILSTCKNLMHARWRCVRSQPLLIYIWRTGQGEGHSE